MAQRGANGPPVTISAGSSAALKLQAVIEAKLVAFLGSYTGENTAGYTPVRPSIAVCVARQKLILLPGWLTDACGPLRAETHLLHRTTTLLSPMGSNPAHALRPQQPCARQSSVAGCVCYRQKLLLPPGCLTGCLTAPALTPSRHPPTVWSPIYPTPCIASRPNPCRADNLKIASPLK